MSDLLEQQGYAQNSQAMDIVHDPTQVDVGDAMEEAATALLHPLVAYLSPRPGVLLCTRPHRKMAKKQRFTASGRVALPDTRGTSMQREYGFVCTVLKIGADLADFVKCGDMVIAAQFAGTPIISPVTGWDTDLWLIGENDVLAVLSP